MSSRTRQPAASRRTRRAEHPQPPAGLAGAESPKIVSNPIFRCEAGPRQQPSTPAPGDHLRCVYRPGSLYALVHDPAAAAGAEGIGVGKAKALPLPLPPCRAHPSVRVGPAAHAVTVRGPHGGVLRRAPRDRDPFLAAYVACSKSAAGFEGDRHRPEQKRGKKKTTMVTKKKCKQGTKGVFRGCGIWNGWAAGAKYAGAMSCRYGCAVAAAVARKEDLPTKPTKEEAENDAPEGPTLNLSWAPAVLAARALERREQR